TNKSWEKYFTFAGAIVFIITSISLTNYFLIKPTEFTSTTVKIVQSGIKQKLKWDRNELAQNFQTHIDLSKQGQPADLIVWSETSSPYDLANWEKARLAATSMLTDNFLITGFVHRRNNDVFNAIGIFSKDEIIELYFKNHLVPFGEYVPLKKFIPLKNITNQIYDLSSGDGLKTITLKDLSFSPLICYEGIFSGQVVAKDSNPDFLLILTNDAWYGMSRGPYQHLDEARFRAIEEGKPVIRAGYNGISAVIDSHGRILKSLPLNEKGIIDSQIPALGRETFYSITSYYPTLLFCFALMIMILIRKKK
ncbi:MAG: apolipoprotein N-acyltransferase, partial [Rickettsiales bacterium]|nr:apolipoprotein N-acyltransferase [Rickettsiales bacterium]